MSVIHCSNHEMKNYFERKIAEGKHVLCIINTVKNKLALRAVAVIKNQTPFVDNFVKVEYNSKIVA